ncbi:MAG: hypothetical protein JJV91_01795 [Desulfosarcina sp.]|nr:hypothetical protein [Desulfobacterales bacterium]
MKKNMRRCQNCGCFFEVCNKVKKHEYCNKKKCRRDRKRKWQKQKIKNDETYRKDQKTAQEDWLKNNPDYWKDYRRKNLKYTERNRKKQRKRNQRAKSATEPIPKPIAKMDALTHENKIISGKYELIPIGSDIIAKMDALIVEINTISQGYAHSGP